MTTEVPKEEQAPVSYSPIRKLAESLGKHSSVKVVYGEPVEVEGKKVIPAAKISYFFGGGGGEGKKNTEEAGRGEGGGGHCSVQPLGVYEITPDRTRFIPTIDLKFMLSLIALLTAVFAIFIKKK